jgi:hypothetical protein
MLLNKVGKAISLFLFKKICHCRTRQKLPLILFLRYHRDWPKKVKLKKCQIIFKSTSNPYIIFLSKQRNIKCDVSLKEIKMIFVGLTFRKLFSSFFDGIIASMV